MPYDMTEQDRENIRQYRTENFKCEVTEAREDFLYKKGKEKVLDVTHNGSQWTNILLLKHEAIDVVNKIIKAFGIKKEDINL